jgi:hypothetical protein
VHDWLHLPILLIVIATSILAVWAFTLARSTRLTVAVLHQRIAALEARASESGIGGTVAAPPPPPEDTPSDISDDLSEEQAELESAVAGALGAVPSNPLAPEPPSPSHPSALEERS